MAPLDDAAAVRRLVDRFGFGAGGAALATAQRRGWSQTLEGILAPTGADAGAAATPPPAVAWSPRPRGVERGGPEIKAWRAAGRRQLTDLTQWWVERMAAADQPLLERMTWFWHGHFATSSHKVRSAFLMYTQNATLRTAALGSFTTLARSMVVDPAMLIWLDGNDNTAQAPNENLSREFMELFTLGAGHYGEPDVKEAARALTGWVVDRETGRARFARRRHDDAPATLLGSTAGLDAPGFVDLVLAQPASAAFVVDRVWFRLVSATALTDASRERLVAAYGDRRDVAALLRAMAGEPAFRDETSALVKSPVEWLTGLLRALGVRLADLPPKRRTRILTALRGMGQIPFAPPSVGGWPAGGAWLTTAAAFSRFEIARVVAAAAPLPSEVSRTSARSRPEVVARLLGVDRFSARTQDAVAGVADRLPLAIAVAACSPEYLVSA